MRARDRGCRGRLHLEPLHCPIISRLYLGYVLNISRLCLAYISAMSRPSFGHVSAISRVVLHKSECATLHHILRISSLGSALVLMPQRAARFWHGVILALAAACTLTFLAHILGEEMCGADLHIGKLAAATAEIVTVSCFLIYIGTVGSHQMVYAWTRSVIDVPLDSLCAQ